MYMVLDCVYHHITNLFESFTLWGSIKQVTLNKKRWMVHDKVYHFTTQLSQHLQEMMVIAAVTFFLHGFLVGLYIINKWFEGNGF